MTGRRQLYSRSTEAFLLRVCLSPPLTMNSDNASLYGMPSRQVTTAIIDRFQFAAVEMEIERAQIQALKTKSEEKVAN